MASIQAFHFPGARPRARWYPLLILFTGFSLTLPIRAQFGESVQYFPQFAVGGGALKVTTFFSIHIPTAQSVTVKVELLGSDGSLFATQEVTLAVADGGIGTAKLADGAVTSAKIAAGQVVKSLNGLKESVTLNAGNNVTITPSGDTLTMASYCGAGGEITAVNAAGGLTAAEPRAM